MQCAYQLAQKFSRLSSIQIWLGLTDTEEDGQFKYVSDAGFPLISFPWGGNILILILYPVQFN